MIDGVKAIKKKVRTIIEQRYQRQWDRRLEAQLPDYHRWITQREMGGLRKEQTEPPAVTSVEASVAVLEYEALADPGVFRELGADIVLLVKSREGIASGAGQRLQRLFSEAPQVLAVYGDEDRMDEQGRRWEPWYKPEFSPDTLLSWFYMGNLVAIRREALQTAREKRDAMFPGLGEAGTKATAWQLELYSLILTLCLPRTSKEVRHCPEILYHCRQESYGFWGMEEEFDRIREGFGRKRLGEQKGDLKEVMEEGVSVIIPSKDNPGLLEQCLYSVRKTITKTACEIIVVDNGSSKENRSRIEALQNQYGFFYEYCPMEFNFSRMCNRGAEKSNRNHLLFLNDDCQPFQMGWLERMKELSALPAVGAVGAKLYYPNSRKIQHCGIYGLELGPVHKLQFQEDERVYYDRRNRDVRNVLAVTAACLMIKKELFLTAGGFHEGFRVAFNDVDLCWRLHEMGYRNLVHNEVQLYHHESYSRGEDVSPGKRQRLMRERRRLKEIHPHLWGKDPYYHPLLTRSILDVGYSCAYQYEEEPQRVSFCRRKKLPVALREDPCLVPSVEFASAAGDWLYGEEGRSRTLYLQGNLVVLGSDNACYEKEILLYHADSETYYSVSPRWRYRPDLAENMKDQRRVAFSGFAVLADTKELLPGTYRLLFLAKEKLTRQCLLRSTEITLCLGEMNEQNGQNEQNGEEEA
ncbi:MAG: glycosyltransferase [Lachnospiraceae bacterium]|nr:glycosyltransferase [Lachnospiraceae bacterium]